MSIGIGNYSPTSPMIDRTGYGVTNGLLAAGVAGGGYLAATSAIAAKGKAVIVRPTPLNLAIGGTIAASAFTSLLASHLCNGSADSRQLAATVGAALPAAAGAALIGWSRTHNPVTTALYGAAGLVAGGATAFLTSPFTVAR